MEQVLLEIISIDYDKEDIIGYVVLYHAHSDFIQLGAELGLLVLSYLEFFYMQFMQFKNLISRGLVKRKNIRFFILIS